MASVKLEGIRKIYQGTAEHVAVHGVDLDVADGEFVVLVGPSGCGKSTTLRMIAGLESITAGVLSIDGRVVNDVPPKNRDIAMVFQNYALYPHMTVRDNLAFALKLRKTPPADIDRRVAKAAEILGITDYLERRPRALSGGQRQRVALGRAIVREPKVFLFDEPLSNLDAQLRVQMRREIAKLHNDLGATMIYVTHDQVEAMTLGDRIVVMRDGVIQQADTPLVTYNYPINRFVAGFIGMPPMNFFDGTIKMANGQMVFEEGKLAHARAVAGAAPGGGAAGGGNGKPRSDEPTVMVGELTLPGNGFTLPLSKLESAVAERLAGQVGRHVVLGIRPEHFHLHSTGDHVAPMNVRVSVTEPLGNDMDVYMSTALHDHVVGRVEAPASGSAAAGGLAMNSQLTVYVDLRKVHFFEPGVTGMNLSLKNERAAAVA